MAESDDLRAFMREIMARADRGFERMERQFDRRMAAAAEERRRYFEVIDAKIDADARRTDDIIAENRAQREALFRMLERLDGNGGAAGAS